MRPLLATIVVVVIAACSSPTVATPSLSSTVVESEPAPTSTSTPSPASPTPTPFDIEAAGVQYVVMAEVINGVRCANQAAINSGDLATATAGYRAIADSLRVFADDLRALELSPDLADTKDEFLQALAASEIATRTVGQATTVDEFNATFDRMVETDAETSALSNFIRAELGLPSTVPSC